MRSPDQSYVVMSHNARYVKLRSRRCLQVLIPLLSDPIEVGEVPKAPASTKNLAKSRKPRAPLVFDSRPSFRLRTGHRAPVAAPRRLVPPPWAIANRVLPGYLSDESHYVDTAVLAAEAHRLTNGLATQHTFDSIYC